MTQPNDAEFSRIAEITRRMKQQKVAEFGDSPDDEDSDLMGFNAGVRAGRQLFVVYHGPGPYAARMCAFWCAMFLSCDEIFQIADARYKVMDAPANDEGLLPTSPEVQEAEFYAAHPEVGPGMLGEAWARGERDGIQECIVIQRYPFLGPPTLAQYEYVREGRKLTWGKIRRENPDQMSGAIDDAIKEGYRKRRQIQPEINAMVAKIHAQMAKQDFSDAEKGYWTDRGMALNVSARQGVFMVQYLSPIDYLPDAVFKDGKEIDPDTMQPVR